MFDQTQAQQEGWCISECIGSAYFPDGWMDIQMWDATSTFKNDLEALAYVANAAANGNQYCTDAIKFWEQSNFKLISK